MQNGNFESLDFLVIFNSILGISNYNENKFQSKNEEEFKNECRNYFKKIIENQEKILKELNYKK